MLYFYSHTMEFLFTTAFDNNGKFNGLIKEGSINEKGDVTYTKNEKHKSFPSFEDVVRAEILRKLEDKSNKEPIAAPPKRHAHEKKSINPPQQDEIKIGVNVKELTDDEFIEYTRKRVQSNKELERFKSIKAKIRATLEGRNYNEAAFNLFVKLHDIDKRGFFNRTKEDDEIISEAIRLYGTA